MVDVLLRLPELPGPGGDVLATDSRIAVGGGLTVLSTAVRQGLPAAYAGMHGTGPMADLAREALRGAGAELLQPRYPGEDTGFTVVMVESDGERTFATSVGAEGELGPAELARLALRPDDFVYVSGLCLVQPRNGPALAEWLSTVDVPVIVDPGPLVADIPADVLDPVLARADWWSCNESEGILLTGEAEPAAALAARTGGVIVRMGPEGCVLAADGEVRWIPGYPVKAFGSSGDVHVGAFAAALAAGESPEASVARANAVAALTLTRHGAAPAAEEVDAFLAAQH